MYKCKHFIIQELVAEDTFEELGEEACWQLFDERALMMIDGIRNFFGLPVLINNWHVGQSFHNRGYRSPDCPIGAIKSMHRYGKAFDMAISGVPAQEARKRIFENKDDKRLQYINRMEAEVSWLHCDVKPVKERIVLFYPENKT